MKAGWRVAAVVGATAFVVLITSLPAHATLSISVPTSTVNLGSVAIGGTLSQQLGTVRVTANGLTLLWTATVASTDFITGSGTPAEKVVKGSIHYWSGPATFTSGLGVTRVPGQVTALQKVSLAGSQTAFRVIGSLVASTTDWNPTIVTVIPAGAVAGTYTGTITHSVA